MLIKLILLFVGALALFFITNFFDEFKKYKLLYQISFIGVIGHFLVPIFLFQGLEKVKDLILPNLVPKILITFLIFNIVTDSSDYITVAILNSIALIVTGVWVQYIILKNKLIIYKFSSKLEIYNQIKDGWTIFYSNIAISLYTISINFILGLLTNYSHVGEFAIVDRVIQFAKGIYQPISQGIYPVASRLFNDNKQIGYSFIIKVIFYTIPPMLIVSILLFTFPGIIINGLYNVKDEKLILILQVMSPIPVVVALSNIFGAQILINIGLKSVFGRILSSAAVIGLILSYLLISEYGSLGAAWTLLSTEVFVTVLMMFYVLKNYRKTSQI
jgi:PST family polysaccharide transporter